ncbi:MAG TPA: hypothetical protein VF729_06525 [Solirubrobacterales bacterium]
MQGRGIDEAAEPPDDFASGFETAFARLQVRLEEVCASEADWPTGMAVAIRAALEFAASDPAAAQTLTNEAMAAGRDGIARRERLLAYAGEALARGRRHCRDGTELPQSTERAVAGGVVGLIAERLATGRAAELPALVPDAIQFALTPYLGAEEATRIAASAR